MSLFWHRHGTKALDLARAAAGNTTTFYANQSTHGAIEALKATYPTRAAEFYPNIGSALLDILIDEEAP
jgi:hypothetical protein